MRRGGSRPTSPSCLRCWAPYRGGTMKAVEKSGAPRPAHSRNQYCSPKRGFRLGKSLFCDGRHSRRSSFWIVIMPLETGASLAPSATSQKESHMRSIVTVAAMALGLGLAGIQTSSAAPVNGTVIQNAADLTQGTEQVQYGYGYRSY